MRNVVPTHGTEVVRLDESGQRQWQDWRGLNGPPVPVIIDLNVWEDLQQAARFTRDPRNHPRVFRLFMKRRTDTPNWVFRGTPETPAVAPLCECARPG